ncbi:MAG: hypothetical protein M0T74_04960 [Desulfitobacterium hafniense]|nr:hypothetical protein [Desulfitobacterium hafniense]
MSVNFLETTSMPLPSKENGGEYKDKKLIHICEVCGKREILTPEEGYKRNWDYSPYMYPFKLISPRTCGDCGIEKTVWWEIAAKHKNFEDLTESQKQTIKRIYNEPESIIAENK